MTNALQRNSLVKRILSVTADTFDDLAIAIFHYQAQNNDLYRQFLDLLKLNVLNIKTIEDIPFLPIQLFKNKIIQTGSWTPTKIFTSSATTGQIPSQHLVKDIALYEQVSVQGFEQFYGAVNDYCVLALLPAYLERKGSSLVHMVDHFIRLSNYAQSGFFLYNQGELVAQIKDCQNQDIPVLLIGVSFALLDLAEKGKIDLTNTIVMETGGMKGRRKEITRGELHQELQDAFHLSTIHSEYGMTELLSQAYSKGKGIFYPTRTLKVLGREITDPFQIQKNKKTGVLNVIDLANIDSCSFIATDDLGRVYEDGSFEVLGRLDNSDIRGCNLMVGDV